MRTVFIFGAGASKKAGAPLMSDFLDTAKKFATSGRVSNRAAFDDVFDLQSELQGIFAKGRLDIDNIETLFGAVEMGEVLKKIGARPPDSIAKLRSSLIALIVETLENSIRHPVSNNQILPAQCYGDFAKMIMTLRDKNPRETLAFITFNYDLGLDHALSFYNLDFNYHLDESANNQALPYLKLHGSINWGSCSECNKVVPYTFREFSANKVFALADINTMVFKLGTGLSQKQHCGKPISGPPVLIPPTWNKGGYHRELSLVWQKAAQALGEAENIFVIGYSLPESDSFFRYLYALGSQSKQLIKRFWVFNPDTDGTVEPRFHALIGNGIANRFRFFRQVFTSSIGVIEGELQKD